MKYILVSWDQSGVEHCEDVTAFHPTEWARTNLFDTIQTNEVNINPLHAQINAMLLRARYNSQRHYEIYMFTANDGLSFDDIRNWGQTDPQAFADWVRKNHVKKIYCDRMQADKVAIT